MRSDSIGLWWQDLPAIKDRHTPTKGHVVKVDRSKVIAIPNTGWTVPTTFPNLSAAKILCVDCETKDPNLLERGPGAVRGDGHVIGIAIGTTDAQWYFPIRHEGPDAHLNMDAANVLQFARDVLSTSVPKVGANLLYDLEFLRAEGVEVNGPLYDVQFAEPLLDEYKRSYSLESLAQQYAGEGKDDTQLYQWLADAYGGKPDRRSQAGNIYRSPVVLCGPYAQSDVRLPLLIFDKQRALLQQHGLWQVFVEECERIPLLLAMRFQGVRVDTAKAEQALTMVKAKEQTARQALHRLTGLDINVSAATDIAKAFDRAGITYPRTDKGNPSFQGKWLEHHPSEVAQLIKEVRRWEKARNPFIENYILNMSVNGVIHCQFHPLKSDDSGTVSGRFSSSTPNLQNIPSRDEEIGPLIRSLFIPFEGERWVKADYSQIEYRLLAHYATGPGANHIRERYTADPDTDYHQAIIELIRDITGVELARKSAKNINFGFIYGMSQDTLAKNLGLEPDVARVLFEAYFNGAPFAKTTMHKINDTAANRGWIKTIGGRHARFPFWEPAKFDSTNVVPLRDQQEAIKQWGRVRRARTHKATNSLMQGGAADILKKAMLLLWQEKVLNTPLLTVHDELDWSLGDDLMAQVPRAKELMEHCVRLAVPVRADFEIGEDWGHVRKFVVG